MKSNRSIFSDITVKLEGVYSNDPLDNGKETCYGVSRVHNPDWEGWDLVDALKDSEEYVPVSSITSQEDVLLAAEKLYEDSYWDPIKADSLPSGVDIFVADMAINQGVNKASAALQRACGATPDGIVGPKTLESVSTLMPEVLLFKVAAERMKQYMYAVDHQVDRFGLGWSNRYLNILMMSLEELREDE